MGAGFNGRIRSWVYEGIAKTKSGLKRNLRDLRDQVLRIDCGYDVAKIYNGTGRRRDVGINL